MAHGAADPGSCSPLALLMASHPGQLLTQVSSEPEVQVPWRPELSGSDFPGIGVPGGCEPLDMRSENNPP